MKRDLSATGRANELLRWRADNFGFLTPREADQIRTIATAIKNRARKQA